MFYPRLMKRSDQLDPQDYQDAMGVCVRCDEVTEVLSPCCYGEVSFEGQRYGVEDFRSVKGSGTEPPAETLSPE